MSRPSNLPLTEANNSKAPDMPSVPPRRSPSLVPRPGDGSRYGGACQGAMSLDYYYGRVTNKQLEELLKPHMDSRGSFLLRDSNTEPGNLTISVVNTPRHIYNFKVNCTAAGLFEVTTKLRFQSLHQLVEHFQINDVPGKDILQLKLLIPIRTRSLRRNSPSSPPSVSPDDIPSLPPRLKSPQVSRRQSDYSEFLDSRAPVPIPTPGTEPIYIDHDHVYCRAEDLKKSRIDEIMELCKMSDEKHKKCTCGLYIEQSILVDNWMMHIDRPDVDRLGSGHIFFVNSVTNLTTWELPDRTMKALANQYPDKLKFVQKLLQEGGNL